MHTYIPLALQTPHSRVYRSCGEMCIERDEMRACDERADYTISMLLTYTVPMSVHVRRHVCEMMSCTPVWSVELEAGELWTYTACNVHAASHVVCDAKILQCAGLRENFLCKRVCRAPPSTLALTFFGSTLVTARTTSWARSRHPTARCGALASQAT